MRAGKLPDFLLAERAVFRKCSCTMQAQGRAFLRMNHTRCGLSRSRASDKPHKLRYIPGKSGMNRMRLNTCWAAAERRT